MTVPASQANRYTYAGNGVTTAFAYSSKFLANADLVVLLVNNTTGVETVKTLTTHYTITGAGTSAGTVTMLTAPATGETLVIYGDPVLSQLVDPVNGDSFDVDSLVEAPLDKLTIIARRLKDVVSRALRQPEGDTADIDRLPAKVTRASKFLAFDADGDPIAADGTTETPVSAYAATILDDTTAVVARATLGVSISATESNIFGPPTAGASLTSGTGNMLLGKRAGRLLTSGANNVVIGEDAGRSGATWFKSVVIGHEAGFALQDGNGTSTGGFQEVLIGEQAGLNLTEGPNNTFVGSSAGKTTTTGGSNTMVGRAAGNDNTTGGFNTFVGHATGFDYTTGDSNTFVGNQAGHPAIAGNPARTGSDNVAIGEDSGPTLETASNTICIGTAAVTALANTGKIGLSLTDFTISGRLFSDNVRTTQTDGAGVTYTVAEFLQGVILRSGPAGAFSDTTPTAAQIVAAIPGCENFTGFNIYIRNGGGGLLTMLAGAGVTLSGTTTVANGDTRMYHVQVTGTGAGAEAVTITGVFTATS